MPVVVYLDETGDHSLEKEDPTFPVFAVVLLAVDVDDYCQKIVPAFYRLKVDYWGHEGAVFHSRDIRKAQGEFAFLTDPAKRPAFYQRVNDVMGGMEYTLISAVIRKQLHAERYGRNADNPYDLALTFALERLLPLLEGLGQRSVVVVAESRGKNEDADLERTFLKVVTYGTEFVSQQRFRQVTFRLVCLPKTRNIIGTQMADLAAYPIARYVIDPARANPAFDIVKAKFYGGAGEMRGLKIFP